MPRFVRDVAGHLPGMSGIFISCVFSASLSTVSAGLHAVSGIIYSDYIRPFKFFQHNDVNANRTMRITIFLLGTFCAISAVFIERFHSIFQCMQTVSGIATGAKFGVFTIGMLYPFANQKVWSTNSFFFLFCAAVSYLIGCSGQNYRICRSRCDDCHKYTILHCWREAEIQCDTDIGREMQQWNTGSCTTNVRENDKFCKW